MINQIDLLFGITIIVLNLIPIILNKSKYLNITIPISLLLGAIKVLFLP